MRDLATLSLWHRRSRLQQPSSLCRKRYEGMGTNRKLCPVTRRTSYFTSFLCQASKPSSSPTLRHSHIVFWYARSGRVGTISAILCLVVSQSFYRFLSYPREAAYWFIDQSWPHQHSKLPKIPCKVLSGKLAEFHIVESHSQLLFLYPCLKCRSAEHWTKRKIHILYRKT